MTLRHRLLACAFVAVVLLPLPAGAKALPTPDARCQRAAPAAIARAEAFGYTVDCTPPAGYDPPSGVDGYTEYAVRTIWIWPVSLSDRAIVKIVWHETGHVWAHVGGHSNTEATADGYAWCHMTPAERDGFAFASRPTDCTPFGP